MRNKKRLMFMFFILFILIMIYLFINYSASNTLINYLFFLLVIFIGLYIITLIANREKTKKAKAKDKLFNSLLKGTNTAYVMMNDDNKVTYMSSNIEDVLGIKKELKTEEEIVYDLLNIPIIKTELRNYNNDKEYVSPIFEYDNPKYSHQMWLKIKIFPYKEKNSKYKIIEIVDATKEHDRQHLLISQASDIKARELKLNQITSSSYDMELNINLITNTCDLKYFKSDNKYFGEEKRGTYTNILNEIKEKYINEKDAEDFYSNLSIENLKDHFNKFELEPIIFRYRIGNEVKNNTWLESTIFFLSNKTSSKVSILTKNVTEDAESIRKQNYMLQNALNDAKNLDKSKTELIATISHDIRTPLTTIMGLSESLLNKNIDSDIKDDIKNIKISSKEVLSIIDGLLDVNNVEKKVIEKEEKLYNIFKMFKIIEDTTKEFINNKNLKLNINLNNNLPVVLKGDYNRITSSIIEIVNNAIKYSQDGEIIINVNGIKKDDNVNIIIEIFDNGVGMTSTKLDEIMNSKESKGINSVKKLMELLDGKLEIESKENEYTKVTLSFVQKIVEDNKLREKIDSNKIAEVFDLSGKRILVVDDNKLNLKVTSRLLELYNINVTLVENGVEALELVKEQNIYDLIFVDQMMPGMDGVTVLNKLKEINNFNTPVVVLTADAIKGSKDRYLNEGFDDYLSKPIDKKELNRVLNKFLKSQE